MGGLPWGSPGFQPHNCKGEEEDRGSGGEGQGDTLPNISLVCPSFSGRATAANPTRNILGLPQLAVGAEVARSLGLPMGRGLHTCCSLCLKHTLPLVLWTVSPFSSLKFSSQISLPSRSPP